MATEIIAATVGRNLWPAAGMSTMVSADANPPADLLLALLARNKALEGMEPFILSFMWCTPLFLFWPHPPFSVINFGLLRQEWIVHHTPLPPTNERRSNLHACT